MSRKLRKIAIFSDKAISNIFFYISASYFLDMFMSIRDKCNPTAMGTGLDLVTFPCMGPQRGKNVSETTKTAIFSYKAI